MQQDNEHAALNSAILSMSLDRGSVPPTPANSPASSPANTQSPANHVTHEIPPLNQNPPSNIPTNSPPDQETQNNSTMQWMWVNGAGPFMTNREFRQVTKSSTAAESDSKTLVLFNLDRLNEDSPEWLHGSAWERGQIPESTDGVNNSLVHRMDRNRIRADFEDLSNGPGVEQPITLTQTHFTTQSMPGSGVENIPSQTVSLDMSLDTIRASGVADTNSSVSSPTSVKSEPGVLGCMGCDQELGNLCSSSRKRFGRNIHQKLMCGFFSKEGNTHLNFTLQNSCYSSFNYMHDEESQYNPKGCWEAGPNQLPQQQ